MIETVFKNISQTDQLEAFTEKFYLDLRDSLPFEPKVQLRVTPLSSHSKAVSVLFILEGVKDRLVISKWGVNYFSLLNEIKKLALRQIHKRNVIHRDRRKLRAAKRRGRPHLIEA